MIKRDEKGRFLKGFNHSAEWKEANSQRMKGRKHSVESKQKMSIAKMGNKGSKYWLGKKRSKEVIEKLMANKPLQPMLGKHHSEESKKKMSIARKGRKGELSGGWKGGKTSIGQLIRTSFEYEDWRKSVFERDLYTCQHCGQIGGYLEADHIKPFAYYPELRFEISNGQTLCKPCHRKTSTYGRKIFHMRNLIKENNTL